MLILYIALSKEINTLYSMYVPNKGILCHFCVKFCRVIQYCASNVYKYFTFQRDSKLLISKLGMLDQDSHFNGRHIEYEITVQPTIHTAIINTVRECRVSRSCDASIMSSAYSRCHRFPLNRLLSVCASHPIATKNRAGLRQHPCLTPPRTSNSAVVPKRVLTLAWHAL